MALAKSASATPPVPAQARSVPSASGMSHNALSARRPRRLPLIEFGPVVFEAFDKVLLPLGQKARETLLPGDKFMVLDALHRAVIGLADPVEPGAQLARDPGHAALLVEVPRGDFIDGFLRHAMHLEPD